MVVAMLFIRELPGFQVAHQQIDMVYPPVSSFEAFKVFDYWIIVRYLVAAVEYFTQDVVGNLYSFFQQMQTDIVKFYRVEIDFGFGSDKRFVGVKFIDFDFVMFGKEFFDFGYFIDLCDIFIQIQTGKFHKKQVL